MPYGLEERGAHADAARAREGVFMQRLRSSVGTDQIVTATLRGAYRAALLGSGRLAAIEAEIRNVVAAHGALSLDTPAGANQFQVFLSAKAREIYQVVAEVADDGQARAELLQALGKPYGANGQSDDDDPNKPNIHAVDNITHKQAPASPDERRKNQIDAFTEAFGHQPASPSDWTTAAALDPHTYSPEYQGVDSEVRVVRIDPRPGHGVVRASQWIAQRDVAGWPHANLGNDRGPDSHFDPESTKVTTYIDYENGIVVMRQNPSVEVGGRAAVGAPQGSVTQAADGSVRIRYDAGNPLVPGAFTDPNGRLGSHRLSVNGDLVFTPGAAGVRVDGTRTDYPSLEVYQDMPGGSTRTVLIDPATSGSMLGPLNLAAHHEIGIGGKAFAPFDRPQFALPTTDFGPVTAPSSVPDHRPRVPA
ncbi:MAG: DUF4226 domain-containing protein [Mycobacterium sp.]